MIIGFSGKRGAGKTISAEYLVSFYGFKKLAFAEELKKKCTLMFPFGHMELHGNMKEQPFKSYQWTPREFMIKYGQFMRYWDQEYWVKQVIDQMNDPAQNYVVDDLRYTNEAKMLKAKLARLIRLERYKKYNIYKSDKYDKDESETQLDDYEHFDAKIEAFDNTNIFELHKKLDFIMKGFGVEKREG